MPKNDPTKQKLMRGERGAPVPKKGKKGAKSAILTCPLDMLETIFAKRTVMGEAERTAVCLWTAHTYIFDRGFTYTPRLFVTSHAPACGKSAVLRLIADCSDGGRKRESGTTLASIRDMRKKGRVTLCLDQLDGTGKVQADDTKLLNLLCSSFEVNAKIEQKEKVITPKGEKWETVESEVGFPIALGKINDLPGEAVMSRCIVIRMQPETEKERDEQMPERKKPLARRRIRENLRTWLKPLQHVYTKAPKGTPSRTEDSWQPLLAIAQQAGPAWVAKAEKAIFEFWDEEEKAVAKEVEILLRVDEATKNSKEQYITGPELDKRLGLTLSPAARGKALARVGLKSERMGGGKTRAYKVAKIRDLAERNRPAL